MTEQTATLMFSIVASSLFSGRMPSGVRSQSTLGVLEEAMKAGIKASLFAIAGFPAAYAQTPSHTPPAAMKCPDDKLVWVNTRCEKAFANRSAA